MEHINHVQLASSNEPMPCSEYVKVNIEPGVGTGPTALGMFSISVSPITSTDQLINVQFIVQYEGQAQTDFTAFFMFPPMDAGCGYAAVPMYAGSDAVSENRAGKSLTVMVVGGVNDTKTPFFCTKQFTTNLWPSS